MGSCANNSGGWFLDYGGLDEEVHAADFIWQAQVDGDPAQASVFGIDLASREENNVDQASRKRNRAVSTAAPGTKACREKMRRDKLNDRFLELSSLLDPEKSSRMVDKSVVISGATRRLVLLRLEAEKLRESNEALQNKIKALKAEKTELKDEKMKLKAEKDRKEQMLRSADTAVPPRGLPYQPAALPLLAAAKKNAPFPTYPPPPPLTMWQWLPATAVDTSQDHVLRPPVA